MTTVFANGSNIQLTSLGNQAVFANGAQIFYPTVSSVILQLIETSIFKSLIFNSKIIK